MQIRGLVSGLVRGLIPSAGSAPASFDPASLFASGEAGGAWAMTAANLRQLSTGSTAVTNGDPVGYVTDLSGNGKHLIQATSGKRPAYVESAGISYLDFDGIDDQLSVALDLSADNKATIVVAWRTVDSGSVKVPLDLGYGLSPADGTFCVYTQPSGADEMHFRLRGTGASAIGIRTVSPSDRNNRHVDTFGIDLSQAVEANKVTCRRDGVSGGVYSTSGALGIANLATGKTLKLCENFGTGFSLAEFSALLIISRVLSSEELANAEAWAASYAGVSL